MMMSPSNHPILSPNSSYSGVDPNWTEFWDNDSSLPYYVHNSTGESSWTQPTLPQVDNGHNNSPFPTSTPHQSSPSLSTGEWEELFDYDNGHTYYYNSTTRESSWEKPTSFRSPIRAGNVNTPVTLDSANTPHTLGTVKSGLNGLISPEPSVLSTRSHVGGLVSNSPIKRTRQDFQSTATKDKKWRKEIDVESGETYYVNNRTEESQWDRPISLPGTFRGDITPSQTPKHFSTGKKKTPTNVQDQWESSIDEVTGERFYTSKVTGEAQWEVPEGFVEPKSLFSELKVRGKVRVDAEPRTASKYYTNIYTNDELRFAYNNPLALSPLQKLDKPTSAASSLLRNMKGEKRLGYSESLRFSTAAGDDDLKKFREREIKRESQVETDVSAGMYEGGALGYILRQKKAAEMLQKYVRGRKARREMRQRLKEKDTWVKENAKRTGAYDDVFDRLRSRGAKIRTLDVWEQVSLRCKTTNMIIQQF